MSKKKKANQDSLPGFDVMPKMESGINDNDPPKRVRLQFKFWLDVLKDVEAAIADELERLKEQRKMAPTIRDALRLFLSLGQGDSSVLLELFPDIRGYFYQQFQAEQADAATQFNEIILRLNQIQQVQSQPAPISSPDEMRSISGPRPIAAQSFEVPSYDDDDDGLLLEVRVDADAGARASANFINSLMALSGH